MAIKFLNCFTDNARWPSNMQTGMVCPLVETNQGLVLIDTGLGLEDYKKPTWMYTLFRFITSTPFDPREAAINQVRQLGYKPEDVRHIVLTHMHFDHCGGLPDFPWATVHVHRKEHEAFSERMKRWTDMAYIKRHGSKVKEWALYDTDCDRWFDFDAVRLPFEPEMWLVALPGHTRGLSGVAIKLHKGWFFHASDSGATNNDSAPRWLVHLVLGPHEERLREFKRAHPDVTLIHSHMPPEWFEQEAPKLENA